MASGGLGSVKTKLSSKYRDETEGKMVSRIVIPKFLLFSPLESPE